MLNAIQKLVFSFQLLMALLRCMTLELATTWFLADGEIHHLRFLFHFVQVLFIQLAVDLDMAIFVAESAMLDVHGWP